VDIKEEIKKAIEANAKSASKNDITADAALKFTQAMLNASHALAAITEIELKAK